jgi:DNA-binding CsgD family transcriptional regulator
MTTEKGGRPTSADADRIALRRAEAVKLRARGKGFQEIADALGVSLGTAHHDVRTAMTEIANESRKFIEAERGTELARLERALEVVEDVLLDPEPLFPDQGEEPTDFEKRIESSRELKLKALDRMVKIQDQRSKLLGLYAPEKKELTGAEGAPIAIDARSALLGRIASLAVAAAPAGTAPSGDSEPERE